MYAVNEEYAPHSDIPVKLGNDAEDVAVELARPETPATESTFLRSDGGRTMSRRAFGEVVRG